MAGLQGAFRAGLSAQGGRALCLRGPRVPPPQLRRLGQPPRLAPGLRRTRWAHPQAALYHLPPDLQSSLQTGLGIAWMLALPFSALPILTGEAKERNERRYEVPSGEEGADNVKWSVMGVLSFIPFLNWLVRRRGREGGCRAVHACRQPRGAGQCWVASPAGRQSELGHPKLCCQVASSTTPLWQALASPSAGLGVCGV